MNKEKNNLFTSWKINNLEIKNRIVMPPMCMFCAKDGYMNWWHIMHYASRAIGGVGLIIVEATSVTKDVGKITDNDLSIHDDKYIEQFSQLVELIHSHGAKIGIQLGHAGIKSQTKKADTIYGPSSIHFNDEITATVKEMDQNDINNVIEDFTNAAVRAYKAGFDCIEIHAAHGYLLSSFLSPITNLRTDEYGTNKAKIVEEVLTSIRKAIGYDYPIIIRISANDWLPNGNKAKDFINILKPLEEKKLIDAINVSSGGVAEKAEIIPYEGYQVQFCTELKPHFNIPLFVGGLVDEPVMANNIVRNNAADAVYIGRGLLRNPYWALNAARELNIDIDYFPTQYLRAKR